MTTIDVGTEFHPRLANRDKHQGDGKYTAVDFRQRFLSSLDGKEEWNFFESQIALDFKNVKKIGPSFANEAFGYFMQYGPPAEFWKRVVITNITRVQKAIIQEELESARTR